MASTAKHDWMAGSPFERCVLAAVEARLILPTTMFVVPQAVSITVVWELMKASVLSTSDEVEKSWTPSDDLRPYGCRHHTLHIQSSQLFYNRHKSLE